MIQRDPRIALEKVRRRRFYHSSPVSIVIFFYLIEFFLFLFSVN